MEEGIITIKLEGIGFKEVERIRKNIHFLISQGVFYVRGGQVILNIDADGLVRIPIEFHFKKYPKELIEGVNNFLIPS